MGRFVIVAYAPKPGCEEGLMDAVRKHIRVLRAENLVSERPASLMRAADGTVVEVFEWRSADAIDQAHVNPAVQALWVEFGEVCDYRPLASLAETQQWFAEFDSIEM